MTKKQRFSVRPGERFGRLTVVEERLRERPGKASLWEAVCVCDCGVEAIVLLQGLRKGTQSCGCAKKRGTMTERFRETRGRPRLSEVSPGDRFDRLTVIREEQRKNSTGSKRWHVVCVCDCGSEVDVLFSNLIRGITRSCGCLQRDHASRIGRASATHGLTDHQHYPRWNNMRKRCDDPSNSHYMHYGGRGIRVCDEWYDVSVFIAYLESQLGPCPEGHSLDRIDNNGHYEPGNVRWASPITQRHNQRRGTSNGKSPVI
jgi:hypothetical protein